MIDVTDKVKGLHSLIAVVLECPWDSPFVLSLLSQFINLRKLLPDLNERSHTPYAWTEPGTKIVLPAVHTLSLATRNPKRCSQVLSNNLHLPSLQHIAAKEERVMLYPRQRMTLYDILRGIQLLPTCSSTGNWSPPAACARLRGLTVKGMEYDPDLLHEIFYGLQELEELVLEGVAIITNELFEILEAEQSALIEETQGWNHCAPSPGHRILPPVHRSEPDPKSEVSRECRVLE
ncbi:hypothetical protein FA13DRAFT_1802114 [Coprinellus micaceus]|uniref:Uncharacterized protein n=1 Tax=Coprinellus micaceus TaxID=71717 RepID=A0A4Y7SDC8_COPMI|nr:hypothetical protein FA13DRAFT_1802114 [Coprinellus micaceus]